MSVHLFCIYTDLLKYLFLLLILWYCILYSFYNTVSGIWNEFVIYHVTRLVYLMHILSKRECLWTVHLISCKGKLFLVYVLSSTLQAYFAKLCTLPSQEFIVYHFLHFHWNLLCTVPLFYYVCDGGGELEVVCICKGGRRGVPLEVKVAFPTESLLQQSCATLPKLILNIGGVWISA